MVLPLASSPEQTQARWHDSVSSSLPDGVSDRFTANATDVPSERAGVSNTPSILVSNTAERHQGWDNVGSVRISAGTLGGQSLATALGLSYTVTPPSGACSGSTTAYWAAAQPNQLTLGTTYTRPPDRVAAALIAAGQQNSLCLTFPRTGSDSSFLLAHAGRDLAISTTVALRSEAPGTWDSTNQNVDSRYRVAFPQATPWNNNFTNLNQSCTQTTTDRIDLRWAWPDPGQQTTTPTPAVDGWELWTRPATTGGTWTQLKQGTGSMRTIDLNRNDLTRGDYQTKIIARLDPLPGTYRVESTHLNSISVAPNGRPTCVGVSTNDAPNPGGPVTLP